MTKKNVKSSLGEVEMSTKASNGQHHVTSHEKANGNIDDNPSLEHLEEDDDDIDLTWSDRMRSYRHNHCIMRPCAIVILLIVGILSFLSGIIMFPQFMLGIVLSPFLRRTVWFVEFLYPMGIARWGHLFLLGLGGDKKKKSSSSSRKKNRGHSRAIEQRFQLVPDRVYVHPIPQLLDNIGYLIVCLPPPSSSSCSTIVAILIDCGDANESLSEIKHIRDVYYPDHADFELQSLLCTHKHHDHTAGNRLLLQKAPKLSNIYGGAVENVPFCNKLVKNGERLVLPSSGENDMNHVAEIECIAVPSHTRGSVIYALRNKVSSKEETTQTESGEKEKAAPIVTHLFTGDAMFAGGAGVPFEADLEFPGDRNWKKKNSNSRIKPGAGINSIDRCFAEILVRSSGDEFMNKRKRKKRCEYYDDDDDDDDDYSNNNNNDDVYDSNPNGRVILFPGHEYTSELMKRQFDPNGNNETGDWNKMPPSVFFDVASRYLVTSHRRTIPKSQRLITSFSSIEAELKFNPHLRSLKKRGEHLMHAVRLWHTYGAREKIEQHGWEDVGEFDGDYEDDVHDDGEERKRKDRTHLDHTDVGRPIFATVYASDLNSVASDLRTGKINSADAAHLLSTLTSQLDVPATTRRPLPNALPTEQSIYLGLLALALLGSAPTGATVSDCVKMNLPRPAQSTDRIRVSFKRLIVVLRVLGVVSDGSNGYGDEDDEDSCDVVRILNLLWREATAAASGEMTPYEKEENALKEKNDDANTAEDMESGRTRTHFENLMDEVELGYLKLILYGATMNQPSWFQSWCLPCGSSSSRNKKDEGTWTTKSTMRRSNGELVGHDPHTCRLCRNNICKVPKFKPADAKIPESNKNEAKPTLPGTYVEPVTPKSTKSSLALELPSDDDGDGECSGPYDEPKTPQTPRAASQNHIGNIPSLLGTDPSEEDDIDNEPQLLPKNVQTQISSLSSNQGAGDEIEAEIVESSSSLF